MIEESVTAGASAEAPRQVAHDDMKLVAAVLEKDRKATAEFVEAHADAIYSYVRRRLLPRKDLVDDLVQEVFLAAWENLRAFRGSSSLQGWLLGIARHKVEDHYRAVLVKPEAPADEAQPFDPPSADPLFDHFMDSERLAAKTRRVLDDLPEAYNLALLWRYWEKRSIREMAQATGKTEKAMERLLARARESFRKRWSSA